MDIIIFMACILAIIVAIAAIKLLFLVLKGIYRLTWWLLNRKHEQKIATQQKHTQEPVQEEASADGLRGTLKSQQETPESALDSAQSRKSTPRPDQSDPWQIYCSDNFTPKLMPVIRPDPDADVAPPQDVTNPPVQPPQQFPLMGDLPGLHPRLDMNPFERFVVIEFSPTPYIFIGKN